MGAAQSNEMRRNLKLEFILAQARGLEGEAFFDHMAALTEAKLANRSRPPSQMTEKSRTPRSRPESTASQRSRPGTGRSLASSRPGTGQNVRFDGSTQNVRFAKPFSPVTYGSFAIPTSRRSHTPKNNGLSQPLGYWGMAWPDNGEARVGTCHSQVDSYQMRSKDRNTRRLAPDYIANIQRNRLTLI